MRPGVTVCSRVGLRAPSTAKNLGIFTPCQTLRVRFSEEKKGFTYGGQDAEMLFLYGVLDQEGPFFGRKKRVYGGQDAEMLLLYGALDQKRSAALVQKILCPVPAPPRGPVGKVQYQVLPGSFARIPVGRYCRVSPCGGVVGFPHAFRCC